MGQKPVVIAAYALMGLSFCGVCVGGGGGGGSEGYFLSSLLT